MYLYLYMYVVCTLYKKIESVLIFAISLTPVLKADAGVAPGLGKG
jgi:hypothetical protein